MTNGVVEGNSTIKWSWGTFARMNVSNYGIVVVAAL